jgi:lipoprotein NlpD
VSGRATLCVLVAASALAGCAEMYRWPDRMSQRPASRAAEPVPEGFYVVKAGDTVYSIAFRNQIDTRELAAWNDLGPDYLIRAGQVIRLTPPLARAETPASAAIQTTPLSRPHVAEPEPEPPPLARNEWRWPTRGAVIKPFGNGAKGVDIGGDLGQPVLAAAPGKVVYSGSALKGYGELIIIKHDEVHLSAYGYNRRRLVGEGVQVAAGQPIAELGLGPEQKPVLHFEVRSRGKPVDPLEFLPDR